MRSPLFIVLMAATMLGGTAQAADLALKRAVLGTGGVGYFEYAAEVSGKDTLTLRARLDQVDDILKSMVILDPAGPASATLPGKAGAEQAFASLPFAKSDLDSMPELISALKGAEIKITGPRTIEGRIASVQTETVTGKDGAVMKHTRVSVLSGVSVEQFILEEAQGLQFRDARLGEQVETALKALRAAQDRSGRDITIKLAEGGKRTVRIGYVAEAPVWKAAYRLTLAKAGEDKARLQGWVVLENMTGNPWKDVAITLSSVSPVTFRQALYDPYYVTRPVSAPPVSRTAMAPTDQGQNAVAVAAQERLRKAEMTMLDRFQMGPNLVRGFEPNGIGPRDINPFGNIERINIRGNMRTRDNVIRRELDFSEGDALNRALVDRAERRLKNLDYFKTVKITTEPGSSADRVILNVDLEEKSTGDFSVSGGYSTKDLGYALTYKNAPDGLLDFRQDFAGMGGDVSYLSRAQELTTDSTENVAGASFTLSVPVSVGSGESLTVPFVDLKLPVQTVAWYRGGRNPWQALTVKNDGGTSLPAGSVTIYEATEAGPLFSGEAQFPLLPAGDSRLIGFAADQKVLVDCETNSASTVISVKAVDGSLHVERRMRQTTTYRLKNGALEVRHMVIEQPRMSDWTLVEPKPEEASIAGQSYRLRFDVEAGQSREFKVVLERPSVETIGIAGVNSESIQALMVAPEISDETRKRLAPVAEAAKASNEAKVEIARLEEQREGITKDQNRLRENLKSAPQDSDLARLYSQKMLAQEKALDEADDAIKQARARYEAARKLLGDRVRAL